MTDRIEVRYQTCKCGHDKASHFREYFSGVDTGETERPYGACLGTYCDCAMYSLAKELR
jgi:hypothetical protein